MKSGEAYRQLHDRKTYPDSDSGFGFHGVVKPRPLTSRPRFKHQLVVIVLLVLVFGILVTIVNIYQLHLLQNDGSRVIPEGRLDIGVKRPVVWINGKKLSSGYLKHVFAVFERLGYQTGDENSDWDVLWAHDYPFVSLRPMLDKLKPHQKVNHFPGSGFLTNKLNLVSSASKLEFIPKAFRLPKDKDKFLTYAFAHKDRKWIKKSNNHRGIQIKAVEDLDLTREGTFVQEFVDDPYLVDGRRFDIGIYATITSINPLRIYVYEGDWLFRFCPEVYYPFDYKILNKYVVTDDYMPQWEMPSLKKHYNELGYNRKQGFFSYVRKRGSDPEQLAQKIYHAIRTTILQKEPYFVQSVNSYASSKNFFEMVRFDFVVDKNLNAYLMEVNMSPNLSSGHYPQNRLLYEQVIYSLMGLIGVARPTQYDITRGTSMEKEMQVSTRNIHVYEDDCSSPKCTDNCRALECKLCHDCLKADQVDTLERAVLEHHNRRYWMRIFPETFTSQQDAKEWSHKTESKFANYSAADQWMTVWYRGKCLQDPMWCP